jgi:hypothetical protein
VSCSVMIFIPSVAEDLGQARERLSSGASATDGSEDAGGDEQDDADNCQPQQ